MARAILLAMLLVLGADAGRAETLESSGVSCIKRVDELCEVRPDQPARAAVMREALAIGLDALEARK